MRLHLSISGNRSIVPYNHIPVLVGTLHKWLGRNDWHNQTALHSFSWLKGAQRGNNGLYFPRGAEWFISSINKEFIKRVISGIQQDPTINFGMSVSSITIQDDPEFPAQHRFTVASPVLIKRKEGDRVRHYTFPDSECNDLLTETMVTKLRRAGLNADGIRVEFDNNYPVARTKLVDYNGIGNKASICPVIVKGTPQQVAFAWNVGIGNSTGIGFGALN